MASKFHPPAAPAWSMFIAVNLVGLCTFSAVPLAQDSPETPDAPNAQPASPDVVDLPQAAPVETSASEPIVAPMPTLDVTPAPANPSKPPSAAATSKWRFTLATELGGMAITGSEIYKYGLGGSFIIGMQRNAWSFEALLLGSYSLQAKGALNAAYTDGSGKLFGIMARRRLAALSVAGGIGGSRLPVLRPPSADVTADPVELMIRAVATEQLGLLVDGRYDVARSRRGNLFVGARLFVPLLTAIPPTHYQPTGATVGTTTPVRTTAQDGPGLALTVGLGFEIIFGD